MGLNIELCKAVYTLMRLCEYIIRVLFDRLLELRPSFDSLPE